MATRHGGLSGSEAQTATETGATEKAQDQGFNQRFNVKAHQAYSYKIIVKTRPELLGCRPRRTTLPWLCCPPDCRGLGVLSQVVSEGNCAAQKFAEGLVVWGVGEGLGDQAADQE